ncbi:MAG: ABC transporter ATP-binding protein [Pseudomonadota bacterium]
MQPVQPISALVKRLWPHIASRRRVQFGLLLALMVLVSFAEILSIGAVLPFLGALTAPERVFDHPLARPLIQMLGITSASQLLLPMTVIFVLAALIAGVMRLLLLWVNTRLSFAVGADISISMYRRTLLQPYSVHLSRNSSEVINSIANKANEVTNSILMGFNIISSAIAIIAIILALVAVDAAVALGTFAGFAVIYSASVLVTRRRLLLNSQRIAQGSSQVIQSLQEGLGAIRDILIDGSQETYCRVYRNADARTRQARGDSTFVSTSPRYVVEALSMIFIACVAYALAQKTDGISRGIPVLGALALGAQRLLPLLQQVYAALTGIRAIQASVADVLDLLDQPLPALPAHPTQPIPFHESIALHQLSFRYGAETPVVLDRLDLTIPKGARTGFIGATGSGKSTLLDIIMGLLSPTDGSLAIDGQAVGPGNCRAWQAHIAHVPQAIFLADTTIEENIAFGLPKELIDHERVRSAARQAQIADVIESWPLGYQAMVGERGVRLSGGQRQRIGIARALYKQADVIIFDEATSALDSDTEQAVMDAIEGLSKDLTILMIAHRLSTLKNCTQIIELAGGSVSRIGTYEEIIAQPHVVSPIDGGQHGQQQTEAASNKEQK